MRALLDYDSVNPESRLVRNADQIPEKQLQIVRQKLKQKILYKKHMEAVREKEEEEMSEGERWQDLVKLKVI